MPDRGLSEVAEMMSDLWSFTKKYYNNADWSAVVKESDELYQKHHCPLMKMFVLAVVSELEKKQFSEVLHR